MIDETLDKVVERFKPEAIVCQCGADGVSGDPHQVINLPDNNFHLLSLSFVLTLCFDLLCNYLRLKIIISLISVWFEC